jgi:hypothetical protein
MSQARADTKGPGVAVRARPMSPHLQIWRWHVTMAASIATRATGVALYVGLLIVAGWALSLAAGADAYAGYMGLLASPIGLLVLFGITVSISTTWPPAFGTWPSTPARASPPPPPAPRLGCASPSASSPPWRCSPSAS